MLSRERFAGFIRNETVFCVSGLAALLSAIFVPPQTAYLGYIDYKVLALLFCLMVVVSGLRGVGAFEVLSQRLLRGGKSVRGISMTLVCLCFALSMFVTNDVTLITMVPFTILSLDFMDHRRLVFVIVMETIAANMGSMMTPVGNPQNLYLYSYYGLDAGQLMKITSPVTLISLLLIIIAIMAVPNEKIDITFDKGITIKEKDLLYMYIALFAVAIATVFDFIDYRRCLFLVLTTATVANRSVLVKVDYCLLMTFIFFFIFVGNIAQLGAVSDFVEGMISGRVLLSGVILSQVISNVPAAVMLSPFTGNYTDLIRGVDIGGLGTLTASLASLISYKIYSRKKDARKKEYLLAFTGMNFGMLALLLTAAAFI